VPPHRALTSFLLFFSLASSARPATVLVLQFHNNSQYSDLNWVGESIAETLMSEFGGADQIVISRASRTEGLRKLSLRSDADFTKATLLKLGQSVDADYVCYGDYGIKLPAGVSDLKNSSIQISAEFLDLKKMHAGPAFAEAGKLSELSRLEEHLAWESLNYVNPSGNLKLDQFLKPQKLIRLDAEESYIRGLMSNNPDQQQKWFTQAILIEPHFTGAAFELGKLELDRKKYSQAIQWFDHISPDDPAYIEARFKMGISAYSMGDYSTAANYFRDVLKAVPLSEVYNNLGACEFQLNQPAALEDFRHALEGNGTDTTYLFNTAAALLKNNKPDEALQRLHALLDRNPNDKEARSLLPRAGNAGSSAGTTPKPFPPLRLKNSFNMTAFRQLKAMLQAKGGTE
jgi:tetratricopeptide (TPR) repeat protein